MNKSKLVQIKLAQRDRYWWSPDNEIFLCEKFIRQFVPHPAFRTTLELRTAYKKGFTRVNLSLDSHDYWVWKIKGITRNTYIGEHFLAMNDEFITNFLQDLLKKRKLPANLNLWFRFV